MAFTFNILPTLNGKTAVIDPRGIIRKEDNTFTYEQDSIILECGSYSYLQATSITRYTIPLNKIIIGKFCSIAQNVKFIGANNHRHDWITSYPLELLVKDQNNLHENQPRNTSVGNDVWIGEGATIMPGVHLSDGCVIGTNSLVTKTTNPYGIYGGNPARLIKYRFSEEIIAKLLEILWWQFNNDFIKNNTEIIFSTPTYETLELLSNIKDERILEEEQVINFVEARLT